MPDFIITNGTVITGSGKPGFKADVIIEGDRIVEINSERKTHVFSNGCVEIDATGMVVCPGFIDPHSHADMTIYRDNHEEILEPLIRQGITTFIGGNCGVAMSPLSSDGNYSVQKMFLESFTARQMDDDIKWTNTAEFMSYIEKGGLLLNCALLAPHGMIRMDVMGMAVRHASDAEIDGMGRILEESMEAGCIGMSTGLQYMPGLQSDTRELVRLGRVLKKYDGIFTSHLRSYMNAINKAVDEVATVAKLNDIRAEVSHIFWVPDLGLTAPLVHAFARALIKLSKFWTVPMKLDEDVEKELRKLARLRKRGIDIGADVMPTSTTFTLLIAYFPPWVVLGTRDDVRERFLNPKIREKIRYDIENGHMVWPHTGRNTWSLNVLKLLGWSSTIIMSVFTDANKHLEGKTLEEIGAIRGKHPFEAMCDLMVEEDARILVFSALGEPEDNFTEQSIFASIKDPDVSISTDTILMGFGMPSALFYGGFPKFYGRYVREMKMMSIEAAVRKTTGLPAEHFDIKQRGFIRKDYFADVVVFDPKTISPNNDFRNPKGTPSGIDHVFINGRHVLDEGTLNLDALPGRLLRK